MRLQLLPLIVYHCRTDIFNAFGYRLSIIAYRYFDFGTLKSLQVFHDDRVVLLSVLRCEKLDVCLCAVCLWSAVCGDKMTNVCIKSVPSHHQTAKKQEQNYITFELRNR